MCFLLFFFVFFFFFNDTATTEIYTLSLHDALPISSTDPVTGSRSHPRHTGPVTRSEEHTSELQSQSNLVCRLLLEKKKKNNYNTLKTKNKNNKNQKKINKRKV